MQIHRRQIEGWSRTLAEMATAQRKLIADGLWQSGPSDFFRILKRERDEMAHTRMLAWLLDPTGRHGLGDSVLRQLLNILQGTEGARSATERTRVGTSFWRSGREADIVFWGNDFTLIIEVKVDADEQLRQCEDLYRNFRHECNPHFLFLTPDGRSPTSTSTKEASRAFTNISWPEVRRMVRSAYDRSVCSSRTSQGTRVVGNYLITLEEQFG